MAYGLADVVQQRRMIDESVGDEDYKRRGRARLDALLAFCESTECRRVRLLDYFGETYSGGAAGELQCGNCDNCLEPPSTWDGTEAAQKILSTILRCERASGFSFGAQHIIDVVRGRDTDKVRERGHAKLSTFGIGADLEEREWRAVLRQLVTRGVVEVDHEGFSTLHLSATSRPVLKGEERVLLRHAMAPRAADKRARGRTVGRTAARAGTEVSGTLFEALRGWRAQTARERGVPA